MAKGVREYLRRIEVPLSNDTSGEADHSNVYLTNVDLLPIPRENRTWNKVTYSLFWFGESASVTSWTVASTAVAAGLAWWEAWICVIVGHLFASLIMTAVGRAGAVYHLGFPTIARCSWGVYGSYWPIFNRNVMTIVWTGVQGVTAGNSVYVLLHALFPSIARVHNPFSSDVTITGGRLIGFAVAWVLTVFCACFEFHRFKKLVVFKSGIMLTCLLAFFIWSIVESKGVGPVVRQGAQIPAGKSHAWVFVTQLFTQMANMATFATNNADLTRYARRPNDAVWTQVLGMPAAFAVVSFFGIFVTSSSSVLFGQTIWDPNSILDMYLTTDYSARRRAGVFFIALGFSFAQITTQIFANLIAAGNDTAALLPRYVNLRRGALVCLVLSFAITPWNLLRSSFTFTKYLTAYQIFLSSIIGVILCDYYWVRRGYIDVPALFRATPGSLYTYARGFHWRAYLAYAIGFVPAFPGFLQQCGVSGIPIGAQRLYIFAMPVGIFVGGGAYALLCHVSPPPGGCLRGWHEVLDDRTDASLDGMEAVDDTSQASVAGQHCSDKDKMYL